MSAVGGLTADEIEKVKKALSAREGQVVKDSLEWERLANVKACPHCGSLRFSKDGHANGRQRFRCKEQKCKRTFNALTGTPLARLHMPEKHLENAMLMADGMTIRQVAAKLGISVPTAFKWRHRFLQAPMTQQPSSLSGVVEADETFFLESFKGQRQNLPRPAKKRGTPAQTPGLGPEQIPVLLAREREAGGTLTARIKSRSAKDIAPELASKMAHYAVLVSDSAKAYRKVAKTLEVNLIQVPRSAKHKTRGAAHINNANSYISRLQG
jgi:transposase-like protein